MSRLPSLFLSHGSPTMALTDGPTERFLDKLGNQLARPKAVLCISAHYLAAEPTLSSGGAPATIHDFYGFPDALYDIDYPAQGDPVLAQRVADLLAKAGVPTHMDPLRGFDHGTWVPIGRMFPEADVPVVQLSLDPRQPPETHHNIGSLLRPLRDEGVLIIGSGGATHNLHQFVRAIPDAPPPDWVSDFDTWLHENLISGHHDELFDYRRRAPHAAKNHPTEEHLLPLYYALGAASPEEPRTRIHWAFSGGALSLAAYAFGDRPGD
ncbi:dioxygenase [Magnetospira sp. QH-2]|uniref:dioxygenase family protein n=1 Tax=Magnetospira sp. (strain QH-2) TaxID=1288970 RepID=UPI0003E814A8|nr:class III extradiol ring-cleavage dioxygenase [Magnetospira sp. QH-2]CCQ73016.1 putative dioxygenase [Magnetospira sp. QH-2]